MLGGSFDKRYAAWAEAEAKVYEAVSGAADAEELAVLRARADLLFSELWDNNEPARSAVVAKTP